MTTRPGQVVSTSIEATPVNNDVRADIGVFPRKAIECSPPIIAGPLTLAAEPPPPTTTRPGAVVQSLAAGEDFFELMHVLPRSFDFGFVLTTQLVPVEVFNGYRRQDNLWNAWVNNAGAGVSLLGMPSLPVTVFALGGILMDLEVTPNGPAIVDTTLDFVFNVSTIYTPITLQRVVLLVNRPENGYDEILEFLTDIRTRKDGSEQRNSGRKNPRQIFDLEMFLEEGLDEERARFENFLFDWQSQVFGVPVWHEETALTAAVTAGATTLPVQSTAFADFRVDGLVAVIDELTGATDVVVSTVINPTSIELDNGVANSYPAGAAVLPLRAATAEPLIQGQRELNEVSRVKLLFSVIDNDISIASLAAFQSFDGKLLLSGYIFSDGQSQELFERQITKLDPGTGIVYRDSQWDRNKRASAWTAVVRGRQAGWEHRQMLHAIRGPQISFYVPTQRDDLVPIMNLNSGSAALDVANAGYAQFVRQRVPKASIRVTFNNGDPQLLRSVLTSVEVDATRETLTLNGTWPTTYTPAQVDRIEIVEKVRFDSDTIRIRHEGAGGQVSRIMAPLKTLFV